MMGSVTLHCDGSLENAEMRAGFYIWQSLPTVSQITKSKLPKKKKKLVKGPCPRSWSIFLEPSFRGRLFAEGEPIGKESSRSTKPAKMGLSSCSITRTSRAKQIANNGQQGPRGRYEG